jgi:hypothetical protein
MSRAREGGEVAKVERERIKVVGGTPNHLPPALAGILMSAGAALCIHGELLYGALLLTAGVALLYVYIRAELKSIAPASGGSAPERKE